MATPVEVMGAVVARAELPGGRHLLSLAAGELARAAAPGQFALLRCTDGREPYLRRALPYLRSSGEVVSFLFQAADPGLEWLARRALGEPVSLIGPLGRGFALHPGTRRLLLAALGGPVAPLLALANLALAAEIGVSLAVDAALATDLAPIIPEAVEMLAAPLDGGTGLPGAPAPPGTVWGIDAGMLAWADQVAVAGPPERLARLAQLDGVLRPGFVQCYVEAPMACGLGWCGSCLAGTRRGLRRVCVGGPVFDLRELI